MIGLGFVGFGYWGPNLVRNFSQLPGARLVALCDASTTRLEKARLLYPQMAGTLQFGELLRNPAVEAIVIATPVATHFELALAALEAGKHVFVEKPLAASSEEGVQLVAEAAQRGLILMVDHPFVYSAAVRKIQEIAHAGQLGDLLYYDSVRINLGRFQPDVNVLWDLATHDLAILDFLTAERPETVSAAGAVHVPGEPHSMAYLTLHYASGLLAHVHVNWLAPVKVRRTLLGGSRKMVVYDEFETDEKVKVYDCGTAVSDDSVAMQRRIGYRTGDMWSPRLEVTEPLAVAAEHFLDCIAAGRVPITDGAAGLRVVRLLEAATESLNAGGSPVRLSRPG